MDDGSNDGASKIDGEGGLNWKGWVVDLAQRFVGWFYFPDIRGQWLRPARKCLLELVSELKPDVVVSSHEPATSVELGLAMHGRGIPWVVDLGDPVVATYTPPRWVRRAGRLERKVAEIAAAVVVTNFRVRDELLAKYPGVADRLHVVTQGFDAEGFPDAVSRDGERDVLELLYTGRFYSFRTIDALVAAVASVQGVRLTVASPQMPDALRSAMTSDPNRFRYLGFVSHDQAIALQRQADVLVNIANEDDRQVPGKFFEYLGAGRYILHVTRHPETDECAGILARTSRGAAIHPEPSEIAGVLRGLLDNRPGPMEGGVGEYRWQALAGSYVSIMERVLAHAGSDKDDLEGRLRHG